MELPIFHFSKKIGDQIGFHGMMMIGMLAYIIRAFGYTVLTASTNYILLVLELLHGVTFALMWSAAVEYVKSPYLEMKFAATS